MVQAVVDFGEREGRVLTIVKGKYGLRNKSDAVNLVIRKFEEEILEPELRPEYVTKLRSLEKHGKFKEYSRLSELRAEIENA